MIFEDACRILGLTGEETEPEIKKRYRQLMQQVHPDVLGDQEPDFAYSAWEINAAYEILMRRDSGQGQVKPRDPAGKKTPRRWQAPVNPNAYTERDIYVDHICMDTGKYYYTEEEGFRMFLHSIYHCTRKVLENCPEWVLDRYLGEAAYLLAQQFVNREMVLKRYETDESSRGMIYYFPAMLETEGRRYAYQAGTALVPGRVRNHRLYLNSPTGKEAGYVSFHDDLIYYALIPLFEQRMAEIKVRVSGSVSGHNNRRAVKVRTLDLWVRLTIGKLEQIEIRLSDRIDALVRKCREEFFAED